MIEINKNVLRKCLLFRRIMLYYRHQMNQKNWSRPNDSSFYLLSQMFFSICVPVSKALDFSRAFGLLKGEGPCQLFEGGVGNDRRGIAPCGDGQFASIPRMN